MATKRVAVDVGSATVRALEITKSGDGVALVNGGRLPLRANPNLAQDQLRNLQMKGVERVFERAGISTRRVVAGISGQSAFIRNIKLPPIPESRVDQIVRYEVQQTIPFRLDEIAVDYQLLQEENSTEMEVILVAMKGEVCEQYMTQLANAKLKVAMLDADPLAIYNAYVFNGYSNDADCTAILDFGASTTTILIEYDGHLRFTRCVGLGGNDITQLLANELGKSFEEAEVIKMQAGVLFPPPGPNAKVSDEHRKISTILTRAIDRLLGEVKLSIGYFRTQSGAVAVSRAFVCGGGAQLKNLRPLIADRLGVQVEFLNPFRKVEVPADKAPLKRQGLEFVTAFGHALRGVAPCAIEITLEPPKYAARRKRQVDVVCYSLSLVLLVVATYFGGQLLTPNLDADRQRLALLEEELARFEPVQEKRTQLRTERDIFNEEYALLRRYARDGVQVFMLMELFTEIMHDKVFLERLEVEAGEDVIKVWGYADTGDIDDNYTRIYEFSQAVETITGATPDLRRNELDDSEDRVRFNMELFQMPQNRAAYDTAMARYRKSLQPEAGAGAVASADATPDTAGEA